VDRRFKGHVQALDKSFRRLRNTRAVKVSRLPTDRPTPGLPVLRRRKSSPRRTERQGTAETRPPPLAVERQTQQRIFRPSARLRKGGCEHADAPSGSIRADLERDPRSARALADAKLRIKPTDVRHAEERHPVRQALLEIYVATALRTPYNDFDTH
jgi:hypothetical protein